MQQVLGGLQQPPPAVASKRGPAQARGALAPPYRPSQRLLRCRARKSRAELVVDVASQPAEASAASGGKPLPHQQHAQPPQPGTQDCQPTESATDALPGSSHEQPKQQPPQRAEAARHTAAAAKSRSGATSSSNGSDGDGSSSGKAAAAPEAAPAALGAAGPEAEPGTQLIFRLERRGDGWAEEILPHLVVEQRPLASRKKRAYSRPDPWKEGSLECYLVDCGVPPDDVDRVVTQAVAWRVTPGGRSLIDRRRRSRVERNVRLVVEHLELECRVPFGPLGIAAILARCPELMLCKPTTNDRWDRRAVELSAFLLRNGHCNVPEDWETNPELGLWVKRQRIARAAGQLGEERLSILQSMGFAFGEVAQLTEEWEHRFDQLVDWMLWHNENHQRFSWLGVDWGARGGLTARELALWTTLQREYRARGLLPGEALTRFEAIGMDWDTPDGTPAEREWMSWFGRLLYLIERHNTLLAPVRQAAAARPKMGRPRGPRSAGDGEEQEASDEEAEAAVGEAGEEEGDAAGEGARRGGAAVAAARRRLQAEMGARRAALAAADLRSEPGLRFWLARQRRRWRLQELPVELGLMLQLAGVVLDPYSPVEWQALAHSVARLLRGSQIALDLRTQRQLRRQQREAAEAAAARAAPADAEAELAAPVAAVAAAVAAQAPGGLARGTMGGGFSGEGRQPAVHQQQQAQAPAAGSMRLRAARWVQTQQALFAEGKLSPAQLRYMAFLGITWVLSDEVVHMAEPRWQEWCSRLAAAPRPLPPRGELWEWLQHQRGLHALGWLPAKRRRALEVLQVRLDSFDRCAADEEWDLRLSELLAYKAEYGHCRPPAAADYAAAGEAPPDAAERQRWAPLAAWLAGQQQMLAAGRLPQPRATQLAAIGAVAPPVRTAVQPQAQDPRQPTTAA